MINEKKKLIFTGGGSGGHVMPALTIIKKINENNIYDVHYIGGISSIERDLVKDYKLSYHPIHTGKLRRYLTFENIKDISRVLLGLLDSYKILLKFKRSETLVFSTGGFISVPVVIAAKIQGKKVFIHEQTSRVGLANKICSLFADKVFISFEESFKYFNKRKTYYSGYPLRSECYDQKIGIVKIKDIILNNQMRPILFITGGGNGSLLLNKLVLKNLSNLTSKYFIVHQTGKAFIEEYEKYQSSRYIPVAFVGTEMIDLFKLATVTISRSGAGTVCELVAVGKKSIFIPLKIAQKNEQYFNALEANRKLGSLIIEENDLSDESFLNALNMIGENNPTKKVSEKNGLIFLIDEINRSLH